MKVEKRTKKIENDERKKKYMSDIDNKEEKKTKKGNKVVKGILMALIIIILLIGAVVGYGYWFVQNKVSKIQQVEVDKNEIEITTGVEEELADYRNIAILGIDSRQDSYSLGNRSDCIVIASINNKTKEVRLVSVYRDTYLELTGRSLDKVTHAYSYGGPTLALSTLNTNLDLDITEFVTVNFEAVKEIVNDLGGVTITVTDAEATQISGINEAGTYTLNGEQALAYARIRKIDTDYKRTERMRNVMAACLEKVKKMSVSELNAITDKVLPRIYTNIDSNEIVSLIPTVASYKITESKGWPPTVEGKIINGVWYGVPVTLESSVKELHRKLFDDEDYTPSNKVKEISEKIINKTGCGK